MISPKCARSSSLILRQGELTHHLEIEFLFKSAEKGKIDMMSRMGAVVAKYVADDDVIERIAKDWEKIAAEPRKVKSAAADADSTSVM